MPAGHNAFLHAPFDISRCSAINIFKRAADGTNCHYSQMQQKKNKTKKTLANRQEARKRSARRASSCLIKRHQQFNAAAT